MRKSVLLLIIITFLLSVVVIGLVGTQALVDDPIIYVKQIELLNDHVEKEYTNDEWITFLRLDYEEGLQFRLRWKTYPEDADNDDVIFVYDTTSDIASVNEIGEVTFYKKGAIKITIKATDGSNTTQAITLIAL